MDLNQWLSERYNLRGNNPIIIPGVDRPNLALWFKEWGFTKGAEIGTYMGQYAEVLCQSNPNLHLICVDPWIAYKGYKDYSTQRSLNRGLVAAKNRLLNYDVEFIQEFSVDGAKHVPDGSLDFVYIDANHELPYVIQDLYAWIPKVRKGGVISGHDYLFGPLCPVLQVVPAIQAYTMANRINKWYVLGRERKPTSDAKKLPKYARSWMWINE